MAHLVWCFFVALALALVGRPVTQAAQSEFSDPEVARGVRLVEEGDYDAAILTLDRAARRLATDPQQARTLSQAYLYLGIAYLGKGHEAAAKAQFREAISHIKDLTLNPAEFPPKVIDLFEAAKEEVGAAATAPAAEAPAAAPPPPSQVPAEEGGGSKLPLILAGVGGGGAAGALLLASGGDSGDGGAVEPVGPQMTTNVFTGTLNGDSECMEHFTEPGGEGVWRAEASWVAESFVWIGIYTEGFELIQEGQLASPTSAFAEWDGCCRFKVELCWVVEENPNPPGNYELRVTFPRP